MKIGDSLNVSYIICCYLEMNRLEIGVLVLF